MNVDSLSESLCFCQALIILIRLDAAPETPGKSVSRSLRLFLCIMVVHMAIDAERKILVHLRRMRLAVTHPAPRPAGMAAAMTVGTGKLTMLELCFPQLFTLFRVTGDTETARRRHLIKNLQRPVHRMAAQAVGHGLAIGMWFVALEALGYLTMFFMAKGAGLLGVTAGKFFKLLALFLMTGQARRGYPVGKLQFKRVMGVGVATQAVGELKVRPALVASAARGNDVPAPGTVFAVAVKTGDRRLVPALVLGNSCRLFLVTLDAVGRIERRPLRRRRPDRADKNQRKNKGGSGQQWSVRILSSLHPGTPPQLPDLPRPTSVERTP